MYLLKQIFCTSLRKPLTFNQLTPRVQLYPVRKLMLKSFNSSKIHDIKQFHRTICTQIPRSFVGKVQEHRISLFRSFKTSEPRNVHPIIWVFVKPFLKFAAILSGRGFRKWWRDLPQDKKKYLLSVLKNNRKKIFTAIFITTIFSTGYYLIHLEETPITKRKRFIAFNPNQLEKINEFQLNQILEKFDSHCLPANHPATQRVEAIVNRILVANKDIDEVKNKKWGVSIVNNSTENAFVLPIGHVFVYTGMLKLCSNDDQLGAILAHEIAHCLQNHGAENISYTHLLDMISIVIIAAIWAILPSDIISLLTHWLYDKTIQLLLQLPYNRKLETEADMVGLHLAAKACFDVRESSAFWSKMSILKKTFGGEPEIEFLSTHPNHEHRSEYLDSIMEQAIKVRKDCGCHSLPYKDPRLDMIGVSEALEMARKQFLQQYPKPAIILK